MLQTAGELQEIVIAPYMIQPADNGKKRTYYRITDSGKAYYREKCEEWQLTKDVIERFISEKN